MLYRGRDLLIFASNGFIEVIYGRGLCLYSSENAIKPAPPQIGRDTHHDDKDHHRDAFQAWGPDPTFNQSPHYEPPFNALSTVAGVIAVIALATVLSLTEAFTSATEIALL